MENNLSKNTWLNMTKTVFGIIYPLITYPYITRVLLAENVGKINFGNSIVSYFSILASLGINSYAIRECSKIKNNRNKLGEVSSQLISINVIFSVIAYVGLIALLITSVKLKNYSNLILIQGLSIILTSVGADWLNTAMEDFKYITIRTIAFQIISIVLMFVFVKKPEDYLIYACISVLASSGAYLINIFYRRKYCDTRLTLKMDLKKHLPSILIFFFMLLTQTIYSNSGITILGFIRGDIEVGLYSVSVKVYSLVNSVIASIAWVVMPQLAVNFKQENYAEINRLLKYSLNFIITLGMPCIVGINVISKPIIEVLGGSEYLLASTSLHILTFSLACSFVGGWMGNMVMLPSGKENVCFKSGAVCSLVNVICNFIFIPKFGLNAVAISTTLSEFLGIIILAPNMDSHINITLGDLFSMFKAPLFGCLLIVMIGTLTNCLISSSMLIVLITVAVSVVAYFICLIIFKNELIVSFKSKRTSN